MNKYDDAVQRGITLLGGEIGHLQALIDLDELNMNSLRNCILGQLFDHYLIGLQKLDIRDPRYCGFALCAGSSNVEYEELTEAWKSALS